MIDEVSNRVGKSFFASKLRNKMKRRIVLLFLIILMLSGCVPLTITQGGSTPSISSPTLLPSQIPTITPSPSNTPSPTNTATPTTFPRTTITTSNIKDIQLIRSYGEQINGEDIVWSPDGKMIALATHDGISFYDGITLGQLSSIKIDWLIPTGRVSPVRGMMISPDGSSILAIRDNGKGSIFDIVTGKEKLKFNDLSSVNGDFCSHDKVLSSYSWWITYIFCLPQETEKFTHEKRIEGSIALAFSPDYKLVALGGPNGVETVSLDNGKFVSSLWNKFYGLGTSVSFSPDGNLLAAGFEQGQVKLFNSATGEETKSVSLGSEVEALNFGSDGHFLAATTSHTGTYIVDAQSFKASKVGEVIPGDVVDIAFSQDENTMATVNTSNTLMLWNTYTGLPVFQYPGKSYESTWPDCAPLGGQVAYSHDGRILAFGETGGVTIFDSATMKTITHLNIDKGYRSSLEFSLDDKYLTAGIESTWPDQENSIPGIIVWSVDSWDISFSVAGDIYTFTNDSYRSGKTFNCINNVAFTSDNKYLLSEGYAGVKVWDVANGKQIEQSSNLKGWNMVFNSFQDQFATTTQLDTYIWEIKENQIGQHPKISLGGSPQYMAFSPDGNLFAASYVSSHVNPGLAIWDVNNQKIIFKYPYKIDFNCPSCGFNDSLNIAFSPDVSLLAVSVGTNFYLFGIKQ